MCIIVVKPAGVALPTENVLRKCWTSNPDGAGYMVSCGDHVEINKGFMTWKEFEKKIRALQAREDDTIVLHFRIATHGEVSEACCHPFPLTGELEAMRKPHSKPRVGVAHNGVISGRSTDKRTSDTMDFVAHVLYPMSKCCESWDTDKWARDVVDDTLDGSRLAVLHGDGNYSLFGNFIADNGCLFSNGSFRGSIFKYMDYQPEYDDDFIPYGAKLWDGVCEYCDMMDDCKYFGRMCGDRDEAAYTAFEGWGDDVIADVVGKKDATGIITARARYEQSWGGTSAVSNPSGEKKPTVGGGNDGCIMVRAKAGK